jgi:hypothetical protein
MILLSALAVAATSFSPFAPQGVPQGAPQSAELTRAATSSSSASSAIDLCEVRVSARADLDRLRAAASDVDDHRPVKDGRARVYADESEQTRLRALGFDVEVVQRDLSSYYAARAAADIHPLVQGGSMGGFKTLAEIGAELDFLAATYPSIVSPKYSLGSSLQGRPIWAMRISKTPLVDDPSKPVAWFDAIHHAREPMGAEALLLMAEHMCSAYPSDPDFKRMVDTRNIVIVPCVNPDGYEYNRSTNPNGGGLWRKNRRNNGDGTFGVDLNRNYGYQWGPQWPGSSSTTSAEDYRGPAAFSEPETQIIRSAMLAHPPGMSFSAHTYADLWLYPWGYIASPSPDDAKFQAWSTIMTPAGWVFGAPPNVLYVANGVSIDWSYGQLGVPGFSPEIGSDADGFWPSPSQIQPLFHQVEPGCLDVAKWAGGWVNTAGATYAEVSGNGDAFVDAGETWDVTLHFVNRGVASVTGNVSLTSSSPYVSVISGDAAFAIGATAFTPNAAHAPGLHHPAQAELVPLRIAIASGAPSGVYTLDAAITYDGVTTVSPFPVDVGTPRLVSLDDMEIASFGWQVSNALNYSWQRAVPQQTTSSGVIVQPGNDDPAGTGTMCWVTGAAAGATAGTNDVDGTTVLTSPLFRASGFSHLELDYARWFADLPGSATDDVLLVEVTNDDGAHWTTLETTGNANVWQTKSFSLESVLPLSNAMRVRITASDNPSNSLCEALIDDVALKTLSSLPTLGEWGTTSSGAQTRLFVDGVPNVAYKIQMSTTSGPGVPVAGTAGLSYLTGTVTDVATGTSAANGRAAVNWNVPAGTVIYLQAIFDQGGPNAAYSNLVTITVL